jgi:predicted nucleotidyltransferase
MKGCTFSDKRKGVALIGLVLVSFIVLSIYSLVVFSIAIRTLNVEVWQSKHYETMRLSYIARSTANAVVEAISDDIGALGPFPIDRHGAATIASINPTDIDVVISGDVSPHIIVKAKAANDNNQSVTVTVRYNSATHKIIQWRDNQ